MSTDLLAKVIRAAELRAIRVSELHTAVVDRLDEAQGVSKFSVNERILGHELIDDPSGRRILVARCSFEVGPPSTGEPFPLRIEVEMRAVYEIRDPQVTLEDCAQFVAQNVPYNLWPYWRELVQSLSLRMVGRALTVPLLKPAMKPLIEEHNGESEPKPKRTRKKKDLAPP